MLRPNLAMDAPPTEISVGGVSYAIHTDYRVWIGVLEELKQLNPDAQTPEEVVELMARVQRIETAVFGKPIDGDLGEILSAIVDFSTGYPQPPVEGSDESAPRRTYSLEWDINAIVIAIRNQSGIDLSYRRREPFHWWEFLEEFRCLCGDHYILKLMEIRGYSGKDSELRRQAARFALPRETTAADRRVLDEFDRIFYNA